MIPRARLADELSKLRHKTKTGNCDGKALVDKGKYTGLKSSYDKTLKNCLCSVWT